MPCAAVIPCFNEEGAIGPLVLAVRKQLALVSLSQRERAGVRESHSDENSVAIHGEEESFYALRQQLATIVVVDDGSNDQTALKAETAGALILRHERNCGKGAALQTGLSQTLKLGFEWAVTLDGDGQHDPADLHALLQCAEQSGALLVIGNRMPYAQAMPRLRRWVNRWMSRKLSNLAGCHLPDTQSGFRLVHLPTWASLRLSAQHFEIESEMLMAFLAAGHSVEFVPIRVVAAARRSRIHPFTDSLRWFKWWRGMRQKRNGLPEIAIRRPPCASVVQEI